MGDHEKPLYTCGVCTTERLKQQVIKCPVGEGCTIWICTNCLETHAEKHTSTEGTGYECPHCHGPYGHPILEGGVRACERCAYFLGLTTFQWCQGCEDWKRGPLEECEACNCFSCFQHTEVHRLHVAEVDCATCDEAVTEFMKCTKCEKHFCNTCAEKHDVYHTNNEAVDHPDHYGGKDNPYEAIKIMKAVMTDEEFRGLCMGTALKYITRAGKKDPTKVKEDLNKAAWYLRYYTGEIE